MLFERTARGVIPTAYGQCLIRHARVMLSELAQTRDELQGLASGGSVSIRVGVLATAAPAADVARYYESLGLLAVLPLELPKLVRPVGIIWNRQRPVSPSTQALMQCLDDVARLARSPKTAADTAVSDTRRQGYALVSHDCRPRC